MYMLIKVEVHNKINYSNVYTYIKWAYDGKDIEM